MRDARSSLIVHVRRVYRLVKAKFPWTQTHYLMESVFSMDQKDRATMSEHMRSRPYLVDAEGIAICRRPRLYWVSWEIYPSPGVQLLPVGNGSWAGYIQVALSAEINPACTC